MLGVHVELEEKETSVTRLKQVIVAVGYIQFNISNLIQVCLPEFSFHF